MNYNREYNQANMIRFFQNGCKKSSQPLQFGLELEHFVVHSNSQESLSYNGEQGIEALMKKIKPLYEESFYSQGHLIGLSRQDLSVSLEPAAQLEVSISPQMDVKTIHEIYQQFYEEIVSVLTEWNCELVTMGYQPKSKAADLELIPKTRYEFMDRYFAGIGPYGRQMMRGTAATQVSIDYYSEEDFGKKYKAAMLLGNMFLELCLNTPVYEGMPLKDEHLDGKVPRLVIWNNTDARRVDISPFLQDNAIDFKGYSDFVMQTPVIVKMQGAEETFSNMTIGEICDERKLEEEELEHVLSMVFPMIRLKHYMEIRLADSMPIESVLCYIILIKGLFIDIDDTLSYLQNWNKEKSRQECLNECLAIVYRHISAKETQYVMQFQEELKHGTILK